MKKVLVMVMAVLMAVSFISCGTKGDTGATGPTGFNGDPGIPGTNFGEIPTSATILLNYNFDADIVGNTPTGWHYAYNPTFSGYPAYTPTVNNLFVSYDKALKINFLDFMLLDDRVIIQSPTLQTLPSTTEGKIYANLDIYLNDNNKSSGIVLYLNQFEKLRVDFTNTLINIYTDKDTYFTVAKKYDSGQWYKISVVYNLNNLLYTVFVNNNVIVENVPSYNIPEQKTNGTLIDSTSSNKSFIGIIGSYSSEARNTSLYIDNAQVYYLNN